MSEFNLIPSPENPLNMKFYKYVKVSDCIKILSEGTLWYSKPEKFNDPFDCYPYFPSNGKDKFFKKLRDKFALEQKTQSKVLRKNFSLMSHTGVGGIIHKLVSNNLTVTCFSKDHLSVPMWAHYADEHQGCAVEFQYSSEVISKISQSTPDLPIIIPFDVDYTDERPTLYNKNGEVNGLTIALSKSTQWSYEKELRALGSKEGIQHFSRVQISKVFTGVRISNENKSAIRKAITDMNKELNIRCRMVELSMAFDRYKFVELD